MINYPEFDGWEDLVSSPSFLSSTDDIISLYQQLTHKNKIFKTFVKQLVVDEKKDKKYDEKTDKKSDGTLVKGVPIDAADVTLSDLNDIFNELDEDEKHSIQKDIQVTAMEEYEEKDIFTMRKHILAPLHKSILRSSSLGKTHIGFERQHAKFDTNIGLREGYYTFSENNSIAKQTSFSTK